MCARADALVHGRPWNVAAQSDGDGPLNPSRRLGSGRQPGGSRLRCCRLAQTETPRHASRAMQHEWIRATGVDVFYREAGPADAPVLLLLHGFANSSFYFRHLMTKLADRFRMFAPDLPSFGFAEIAEARNYHYHFALLARTMTAFVDASMLKRDIMFVFDYGASVGWELALTDSEHSPNEALSAFAASQAAVFPD